MIPPTVEVRVDDVHRPSGHIWHHHPRGLAMGGPRSFDLPPSNGMPSLAPHLFDRESLCEERRSTHNSQAHKRWISLNLMGRITKCG